MNSLTSYKDETATYWQLVKDLRDEVKLRLITLLSESISTKLEHSNQEIIPSSTEEFLSEFYGAWKGDMSAEEIIRNIETNRSDKDPIDFAK